MPLAAGGPGDVLTRTMGQPVVIDNRPGAKASADGYTLLSTGKLRALGTTGEKRMTAAPELPPVAESGLPGYEVSVWYGIVTPAGTPPAVITRLHAEISKIVQLQDIKNRWAVLGAEPLHSTPDQFATFIKADIGKWAKVVRAANVKLD